ncbi:MAG: DUF1269 domain-containing protein [Thermomicrobiales bacterium]|nr:DUF1269 domain-containing protein [Thermomicrobiales bacterium]
MATLTVTKFESPDGAERALDVLRGLEPQRLITIQDAATVSWPEGAKKPRTHEMSNATGAGALGGAFWGMLLGLIFFMPFLGAAIGAVSGALAGRFSDFGISDSFIKSVRDRVTPGTSALFLLTSNEVVDRVAQALKDAGLHGEVIETNLSTEQEAKLREAFGEA